MQKTAAKAAKTGLGKKAAKRLRAAAAAEAAATAEATAAVEAAAAVEDVVVEEVRKDVGGAESKSPARCPACGFACCQTYEVPCLCGVLL